MLCGVRARARTPRERRRGRHAARWRRGARSRRRLVWSELVALPVGNLLTTCHSHVPGCQQLLRPSEARHGSRWCIVRGGSTEAARSARGAPQLGHVRRCEARLGRVTPRSNCAQGVNRAVSDRSHRALCASWRVPGGLRVLWGIIRHRLDPRTGGSWTSFPIWKVLNSYSTK